MSFWLFGEDFGDLELARRARDDEIAYICVVDDMGHIFVMAGGALAN